MYSNLTDTSTGDSSSTIYVYWSNQSSDTTTTTYWDRTPEVVVVRPSVYRGERERAPVKVLTEKMLRDMAAAAAHHRFIAESVRLPPPPPVPQVRARNGFYQGPRLSCHSSTRTR